MGFRIFVGNLSHEAGEKDLRQAFSAFQGITDCRIILDRETGASRGFAFVEFQDSAEGRRAIQELDGHELLGRSLRLTEATPQEGGARGPGGDRRPPPGGRFGDRPPSRGPDRDGARPPLPRRDGGDGDQPPPPRGGGDEDRERRQRPAPKEKRPEESRDRNAKPHGRPPERERGGAHNRFVYDEDEEDEDFDPFGEEEDEDFDPSILERLEGVEYEPDEDEPGDAEPDVDPDRER